jgi:hypothetical protein
MLELIFHLAYYHGLKAAIRAEMPVSPDKILILAEAGHSAGISDVQSSDG